MEERDWRVIQVLHQERSITRTAQLLNISQPALTARLRHIEDDLGATIALRTSKGVRFTPQGEYLAEAAATMLREFSDIRGRLRAFDGGERGVLRIAASRYMLKYWLPELLKRFKDVHPTTEFRLVSAWSRDVYGMLRNKDVHVGFVLDSGDWEGNTLLLFRDPLCVVSSIPVEFERLPELPRIEYRANPGSRAAIDRWWHENFNQAPLICMEVDTLESCHEMVRHGMGYAILPGMVARGDPNLRIEPLRGSDHAPLQRSGWMLWSDAAPGLPVVDRFVGFVKDSGTQGGGIIT